MNKDGWKYNNNKGKQKIMVGQKWPPLSNKYELLTLEDNENTTTEREPRTKANPESNYVKAINDTQKLHEEDALLVDDTDQMHHESMDEVGETSIGTIISPLKEQAKSLVTTQQIKGIAKMKSHMHARKEDENGMEINKDMRTWPRVKWNPGCKVTSLLNTGCQQIKLKDKKKLVQGNVWK